MIGRRAAHLAMWIGASVTGLLIGLWHPGQNSAFWSGVEGTLLDARFVLRGPLDPPLDVAVVLIDDQDIARLGAFPPPRIALAAAVDAIAAAGATALALDLLLIEPRAGDTELADALARMDRAVLAVARVEPGSPSATAALSDAIARSEIDVVIGMPPAFAAGAVGPDSTLARAATLGHVNFAPDPDGTLRRMPAAITLTTDGAQVRLPSIALAALRSDTRDGGFPLILRAPAGVRGGAIEFGDTHVALDRYGAIPLVFYGPQGTVPTWPLREVGQADLSGKVVFLGLAGTGVGDRHATPFDAMLPGVEVQATLAANLLEGRHLRRDNAVWLVDTILALAIAAAGSVAASLGRSLLTTGLLAGVAVAVAGLVQTAFLAGWWLDATTLSLSFAAGTGLGLSFRLARLQSRARNLARYVSPLLADTLAERRRPTFEGRTQQAIALFIDIEGSTPRSEAYGPEATASFLRRFHEAVERAAVAGDGVIEQFAGDGAMIVFGLPEPGPGDAAAALRCIEAVFTEVARGTEAIPIRVGAHMGRVRADVLGGTRQRHVTITGDVVNAASRLQEIAKDAGARVALSDVLLQSSGAPAEWIARLGLQEMDLQVIRGREARLHVWAGPGALGRSD